MLAFLRQRGAILAAPAALALAFLATIAYDHASRSQNRPKPLGATPAEDSDDDLRASTASAAASDAFATPSAQRSGPPSKPPREPKHFHVLGNPKSWKLLAKAPLVLIVPLLVVSAAPVLAATASLRATPLEGLPGTRVVIVGAHFPSHARVVLAWDGRLSIGRVYASATGHIRAVVRVPATAHAGLHRVVALVRPAGSHVPLSRARRMATTLIRVQSAAATTAGTTPPGSDPTTSPQPGPSATPKPTTTPTPAPTSGGTSSGAAMPNSSLPGWRLIFNDDFNTNVPLGSFPTAVSGKWKAYGAGWKDTSGHGTYNPYKVVSIANSMMDLWIHSENGVHYVSTEMPALPGGMDQLYGRYAIRFKSQIFHGYKTAWLLWPQGSWPYDGEIDFPEANIDSTIHAYMHRQNAISGSDQDWYATNTGYGSWHTAVIEWKPGSCQFFLDGVSIGHSTSRVPNTPMHWDIQTETALGGAPAPDNSWQGHVSIDWVAVWAYSP